MRATLFPPVDDHAELREGESQEGSHRVERDQPVCNAIEEDQQEAGEQGENHDAVGVDQAAAAIAEGVRQVIVLRDSAAETGEIGECSVRGKGENEEDRGDGEVIKNTFAENRGDQHGEKTLVAGLARVGGRYAI